MPAQSRQTVHSSGECEIDLARRELRLRGDPVAIGARAFGILEELVESTGTLVSKDDLMARVWSGAIVEEHTLQVHISAVRKALGPYRDMLKTESGRGYRLTGRWTIRQDSTPTAPVDPTPALALPDSFQSNLPVLASDLIGRTGVVEQLQDLLSAYRVVTLTGPGGIGKTTLSLEVARHVLPALQGDGWFVELAAVSDPELMPSAVAGVLNLQLGASAMSHVSVARAIGDKKTLLILDNCEHVIDAAAALAETVVRLCPHTSILATSREALRIEGEHIYRVLPLDVPHHDHRDTNDILRRSAVQLFISRTRALHSDFTPRAETIPIIAAICRRLDGIPLAIEFAAARAATLGLEPVLARLDDRFRLLVGNRRTALPKDRTLRATLDWSYELLSSPERVLLQRLAVFAAGFSLEAARMVVGDGDGIPTDIADGIASLVEKSLVTTDNAETIVQFRLLETTRAYALEKLSESGALRQFARRHADYYRGFLQREQDAQDTMSIDPAELTNVRAALEWCFSAVGDANTRVGLAAAATPVLLAMSLLAECRRWAERALPDLDDASRGTRAELQLQAALGISLVFTRGDRAAIHMALHRGLALAEEHGDALTQLRLLGPLYIFHLRIGDFQAALRHARHAARVSRTMTDPVAVALGHCILGIALQRTGDLRGARAELETVLRHGPGAQRTSTTYLGFDGYSIAGAHLARTLWLLGHPAQAVDRAHRTLDDAASLNHPVTLSMVLIRAISVFRATGDLQRTEELIDWLISHARSHSLAYYLALGRGFKGQLAIRRGDPGTGVEILRNCLTELGAGLYDVRSTILKIALVQGLTAMGRFAEGRILIDETLQRSEANGDVSYMPELLRVKGNALLAMAQGNDEEAELCFRQSLDWSRRHGARAWELRTAIALAELWTTKGRLKDARALLQPVFDQFVEGFETADLKTAGRLLASLS